MITKIKKGIEEWLRQFARQLQFQSSHLTASEQRIMVVVFWLLSLALSYYLLSLHINN